MIPGVGRQGERVTRRGGEEPGHLSPLFKQKARESFKLGFSKSVGAERDRRRKKKVGWF